MTRRAPFREADVSRAIRGAIKAGLPAGSFTVEIVAGAIRLLPLGQSGAHASIDEAEATWDKALGLR